MRGSIRGRAISSSLASEVSATSEGDDKGERCEPGEPLMKEKREIEGKVGTWEIRMDATTVEGVASNQRMNWKQNIKLT